MSQLVKPVHHPATESQLVAMLTGGLPKPKATTPKPQANLVWLDGPQGSRFTAVEKAEIRRIMAL